MNISVLKIKLILLTFIVFNFSGTISKSENEMTAIEFENDLLTQINSYRISKNLPELKVSDAAAYYSEKHNNYMISVGDTSHDNFKMRSDELFKKSEAVYVGETIAFGFNDPKILLNGWLNSKRHREVIDFKEFSHVGISVTPNKSGRKYVTAIFIGKELNLQNP